MYVYLRVVATHPNSFHQACSRFLTYTPPPPPIGAQQPGEPEDIVHKTKRKWGEEVRKAEMSDEKVAGFCERIRSRSTRNVKRVMRGLPTAQMDNASRLAFEDMPKTKKTVGVQEIVLFYPDHMDETESQMREQFLETMIRTTDQAEKDEWLAIGLLPAAFAIDTLLTPIWPFGGLVEIDLYWAYESHMAGKNAHSIVKRIHSAMPAAEHVTETITRNSWIPPPWEIVESAWNALPAWRRSSEKPPESDKEHDAQSTEQKEPRLKLRFQKSDSIRPLQDYLGWKCYELDDDDYFDDDALRERPVPSDDTLVNVMGWQPSAEGDETANWESVEENERWQRKEVKADVQMVLQKAAKQWIKWLRAFEGHPDKAIEKQNF